MLGTSLAFVPRQVTLAKPTITSTEMAKPKHAETLESEDPLIAKSTKKDSKKATKKSKSKSSDDLSPILLSIADFLKQHGFSKTLAALQSEASIDEIGDGGGEVCGMDLESYYKHLKTSQFDKKADLHVREKLDVQMFDTSSKEKDKKKKKSNSIDSENVEHDCTETLSLEEENMKPKDAKRKKHKKPSETLDGDVRGSNPEDMEVVIKRISENSESSKLASENGNVENHLDCNHNKSKDKKHKKKHSSERSGGEEDVEKHSSEKEGSATLEVPAVGGERKSSKKRKKAASEDDELQPSGKIKSKKAKQGEVGVEGEGNDKSNSEPEIRNAASKKRKIENGGYVIESPEVPLVKDLNGLSSVKDSPDELIKENSTNNGLENSEPVKSATQKSTKKQQNRSAEPKASTPFQRVKVDQVEFADDRLQDNSYWAKDGAETGYGAKAQEVLGQVRGRDFRHEKTKKKRGSYRGGQIDQQSHSIKFQYSDDE